MKSIMACEFVTTCIKKIVNKHVIESIARRIKEAMLYVLQQFQNTGVLHSEFSRKMKNLIAITKFCVLNRLPSHVFNLYYPMTDQTSLLFNI